MSELDLDALAALEEAATPVGWSPEDVYSLVCPSQIDGFVWAERRAEHEARIAANKALVAALRNAAPALIAAARNARPCDGGCSYNDGPQEECSLHGRSPADLWQMLATACAERDAAQAAVARVEALHRRVPAKAAFYGDKDAEKCRECKQPWPCATIRALRGEESGS